MSSRVESFESEANDKGMRLALYLIDEVRDEANTKIVEYEKRTSSYYNMRVRERSLKEGGLVHRKIEALGVGQRGKLAPNWEGPFNVQVLRGTGAYKHKIMKEIEG